MKTIAETAVLAVCLTMFATAQAPDLAAGKTLYNHKCAVCHGTDGHAKTAKGRKLKVRDLRDPKATGLSDEQTLKLIQKGKGDMSGFAKELAPAEIHDIIAYERELAKTP